MSPVARAPTPSPPGVGITPAGQPIQRQLTEHGDLCNSQQRFTTRPLKRLRQVTGHYIGRRQGFTGVNQQAFGIESGLIAYIVLGAHLRVLMSLVLREWSRELALWAPHLEQNR